MEFTLLGASLLGILGLYGMLWIETRRGSATDCAGDLWEVGLGSLMAGVAVGRVTAMIAGGVSPIAHPGDLFILRGGVDTAGAAIGALAGLAWFARRDLWRIADGLAAASLAGLAGWHAGCLVRDACAGTPTGLPWAVTGPGGTIQRHPVEIYAALLLAAAAVAVVLWKRRAPASGAAGGVALAVAGAARLVTEPLRVTLGADPWPWYAAATVTGAGLAWWRIHVARPDRSADGDEGVQSFPEL